MENQSDEQDYRLPPDEDIERASMEAAGRAIKHVAGLQRQNRQNFRPLFLPMLKVAAVITVVSALTFLFYQQKKPPAQAMVTVETVAGERKRVTLPDGSIAELNAASALTYPAQFGDQREIRLSGEAFFTVQRDPKHPFVVHSDKLNVTVLGTSFNVKSYSTDAASRVTVATGKVSVRHNAQSAAAPEILLPGDQLTFTHATSLFTKRQVDPGEAADWQQLVLSFEFQTLADISKELGRVYGVTFDIQNRQLAQRKFQLRVKNESLDNILKLLSISGGGFSYQLRDKKVTIQ